MVASHLSSASSLITLAISSSAPLLPSTPVTRLAGCWRWKGSSTGPSAVFRIGCCASTDSLRRQPPWRGAGNGANRATDSVTCPTPARRPTRHRRAFRIPRAGKAVCPLLCARNNEARGRGLLLFWRRERDSNPRYGFGPYTRFPGVHLQPLGHLSVAPSRGARRRPRRIPHGAGCGNRGPSQYPCSRATRADAAASTSSATDRSPPSEASR